MECLTTLAATTATTTLSPTTSTTSSSQATTTPSSAAASSNTSEDKIRRHCESLAKLLSERTQTSLAGGGVSQVQKFQLSANLNGNSGITLIVNNLIIHPGEVTVWEANQVNCDRAEVEKAEMMPVNSTCNFNYAAPQVSDEEDNDVSTRTDDNNKDHEVTKMEVTESGKLTLLLVGRTGNGKSSTGNSILGGRKVFTPRGSTAAITAEILKQTADIDGQEITVVDGPGIGDASFDNNKEIQATLDQVDEAFNLSPDGFSALLIVLKYGIRFIQQEKDAITMIKSIFGPDVVRKYGVIVMSHGDSFELDTGDEEMSFEDWCKEQTGDVKALFTECDNRRVLFNNKTEDKENMKTQNDSLMSKVTSISSQVTNYTREQYKMAIQERTKLLVKSKLPQMKEKIEKGLDEINEKLKQVGNDNSEASVGVLNDCIAKVNDLKSYLQKEDENTGCTKDLQMRLEIVETNIRHKLRRCTEQNYGSIENSSSSEQCSAIDQFSHCPTCYECQDCCIMTCCRNSQENRFKRFS